MISEHTLASGLASTNNWAIAYRGSAKTGWHLIYHGRLVDYDVYLDAEDQWVYLQCPLLRHTPLPRCRAVHEFLLRVNDRMFMTKFTVFRAQGEAQSADWIALVTESPAEVFTVSVFRLMLEAIATYAEQYDREVRVVATDRKVAALLSKAEWLE